MKSDTIKRKNEHLKICLEEEVEYINLKTGFDAHRFVPQGLPEINMSEIDMTTTFLGETASRPYSHLWYDWWNRGGENH